MMEVLMIVGIILAVALIVLVLIQPRQSQLFSMDATSNIGKPGYWQNNRLVKIITLLLSLALFVLLLVFMIVTYQ
nr:preprotein translocase subunit SecG [Streptococcus oralis]